MSRDETFQGQEYWQKEGIRQEIKDALETLHSTWHPEELNKIFDYSRERSLTPVRSFFEALATHDIADEDLGVVLPGLFNETAKHYIEVCDLLGDERFGPSLLSRGMGRKQTIFFPAKDFFIGLVNADAETQIAWAKGVRQDFLNARSQLEGELEALNNELLDLVPEDCRLAMRNIVGSMIAVSREEWLTIAPTILDKEILAADSETGASHRQLMQKATLEVGFGGMRTFPNTLGESCAVTIMDTDLTFVDGVVRVLPSLARASSAQRHEAAHLIDELGLLDLPSEGRTSNIVKLVRMGFREDVMDLTNHKLLRVNESFSRSAIEEGWAVYFQLQKGTGAALPEITQDYMTSYTTVKEIIEYMGLENFLKARMQHNIEPVALALKEIDPDGKKYTALSEASRAINVGLVSI
ncbi:MAG: hypothetical protein WC988_00750 [Patescibacteria group bacterium]